MTLAPITLCFRAPSTTANLGPGFDCLGLALQQENRWTLEVTDQEAPGVCRVVETTGEGARTLPKDESHHFFSSWRTLHERGCGSDLFESLRRAGLGARLTAHNVTPLARGLGSSAAVRVASAEAYRRLADGVALQAWQLGSVIEGHPDNAAPAGLGGLISGLKDNDNVWRALSHEIHDCWQLVVAIPAFSLLTSEARRVLPKKYDKAAAIYNLSRLPYVIEGLKRGEAELLRWGCDDRWHQPYRCDLIPGFSAVVEAGLAEGAASVYLSGAGPTMAAFVDRREGRAEAVGEAMRGAFESNGVSAAALTLEIDHTGLEVVEASPG